MDIEDVGFNPERLAKAVHDQMDCLTGRVPVEEIAKALDIVEIRREPVTSFEGALLMLPDRNVGSIIVNGNSSSKRQRFTIAHELGHFLNLNHRPTDEAGFGCTKNDMGAWSSDAPLDRHARQEIEANRFAIELLAPRERFKPALRQTPDLRHILDLGRELGLSKEATARRYIEFHDEALAVAFGKEGRCRYVVPSSCCPYIAIRKDQQLPVLPLEQEQGQPTHFDEADAGDWLSNTTKNEVQIQTLWQQDGHTMTLVTVDAPNADRGDDGDGIGLEDTVERFKRVS